MSEKIIPSNEPAQAASEPIKASYTEYTVIPSQGYCQFVKCKKGDQPVVLKGLKEAYRERVLLRNALKREFKQCQRHESSRHCSLSKDWLMLRDMGSVLKKNTLMDAPYRRI